MIQLTTNQQKRLHQARERQEQEREKSKAIAKRSFFRSLKQALAKLIQKNNYQGA